GEPGTSATWVTTTPPACAGQPVPRASATGGDNDCHDPNPARRSRRVIRTMSRRHAGLMAAIVGAGGLLLVPPVGADAPTIPGPHDMARAAEAGRQAGPAQANTATRAAGGRVSAAAATPPPPGFV